MRILIVSNIYPPTVIGGYEVGCEAVAGGLSVNHEVLVLTSPAGDGRREIEGGDDPPRPAQSRELAVLTPDAKGALRAPLASLRGVAAARRALAWRPDLIYAWNGASIPQAALRVFADSGTPLAFRVEEHWFASIFLADQFLRELLPARRGPARAAWAGGCRMVNAWPSLHLDPVAPLRAAISWNSQATRRIALPPAFVETVLERVTHPAPPRGDLYAAIERDPAPEPRIVFLGRVSPPKGVAVAIEALALLRRRLDLPASLEVLGPEEGDHGTELRALAERLGVAEAVHWHGQASPAQVAAELARAQAMIVPSIWEEPFGYVTVEGALARVPLVTSDVGGIGEAMHDEEHALMFERADAPAAAAALARTLRETEQTAARVARAYARAQEFRLGPYLEKQERFVLDAHAALRARTRR